MPSPPRAPTPRSTDGPHSRCREPAAVHAHRRPTSSSSAPTSQIRREKEGEPNPPWLQPNRAFPRQRQAPPAAASPSNSSCSATGREKRPLTGSIAAPVAPPAPALGAGSRLRPCLPLARVAVAVLRFVRLTAAGIPHASWRRAGRRRRVVGPVRVGSTSTQPRAGDGEEQAGKANADLRHLTRLHDRRPWTTTPASQRQEVPAALLAGERRHGGPCSPHAARRPAVERIEFGSSRAASVTATARGWFSRCARRRRSSGRRGWILAKWALGIWPAAIAAQWGRNWRRRCLLAAAASWGLSACYSTKGER
ncbi:unnamed protein product [Urochloa humidicola]